MKNLISDKYRRDEDGRIIINMHVKDDTDFLSIFSVTDTPVISNDVADFIENGTMNILPKEPLTLRVKSDCIDDNEKKVYNKAIKEYYSEKAKINKIELKKYNRIALILALIGVFILAFAIFLEYQKGSVLWAEVIDIAAWVLLWEAVDIKFFKTMELNVKRKRYKSLLDMKIEYISTSINEKAD